VTALTDLPPIGTGICSSCHGPAPDGAVHRGVGLLCGQCADLRYDAYLDWYDSR